MLGQIGIEGGSTIDATTVVINDCFKGLEASVVHIGRGKGDITQLGRGEFVAVSRCLCDFRQP